MDSCLRNVMLSRLIALFMIDMENRDYDFIRYYLGRHKVMMVNMGKKAFVVHLEKGHVGNKDEGYKSVDFLDMDITLSRFCRRVRRNG